MSKCVSRFSPVGVAPALYRRSVGTRTILLPVMILNGTWYRFHCYSISSRISASSVPVRYTFQLPSRSALFPRSPVSARPAHAIRDRQRHRRPCQHGANASVVRVMVRVVCAAPRQDLGARPSGRPLSVDQLAAPNRESARRSRPLTTRSGECDGPSRVLAHSAHSASTATQNAMEGRHRIGPRAHRGRPAPASVMARRP